MSTTRWIIETRCPDCGRMTGITEFDEIDENGVGHHHKGQGRCPGPGGSRVVVDPDNLPPEAIQRAAEAVEMHLLVDVQQPYAKRIAEAAVRAFLSDPEPGVEVDQ